MQKRQKWNKQWKMERRKFHYVTLDLFDEVFNLEERNCNKRYSFMYDQDITTYYIE